MNFLERNADNLKSGNLTLTLIMLAALLGMSGWMYIDFTQNEKTVNGSANITVLPEVNGIPYKGDCYSAVATLMSIIIISAIVLGILVSKINNEYFKNDSLEIILIFILLLSALTLSILDLVPDETEGANTDELLYREATYAVSSIILVSVVLGMVSNISGIAKMYNVFGTGVALTLMVIVLGLYAYLYTVLVSGNQGGATYDGKTRPTTGAWTDNQDNLGRQLTAGESNVLISALSFICVLVVLAFFHIFMERKTFHKMFGMKSPTRSESPKRKVSPRRKTRA